ncbi:ABC transporter permease [Kaistia dalseonensis]|uniref:Autoinducer 2 import system permease protein LsrD n=1 Tax=Kaistia dalseonensis TaxID=410840 RepID=A0ABU0H6W9_9HYPH|nr:ABC transporter permease [Kaistia dalseonensis]MCX5495441.1 ABC transporter permease [Kaistia dalseonensis]MDQ0438030.1 ribose transport system permease protein [Kaistia dalseonensis]
MNAEPGFIRRLVAKPWLWAYVAAAAVWLVTILFTGGRGGGEVLTAAFTFATFSVIVGIGQLYVVTLGPGNVDLSIPATITLAGAVATKVMDTQDGLILVGLIVALACGVAVGCFNYALIIILRIPPIIATLSSSFLIQSTAIAYGRGIRIKPPAALADFTTAQVLGMPVLALCVIALAAVMEIVLRRTVYGRWVTAIGQNMRAARLAGVNVGRTRFTAYVMSAVFAGLCGYLLSGFSGGSSLSMGEEYLLTSIALVVIGGSSVAGGYSNVPGLWGAALFLFLVVTMLNTYGFGAGLRYLSTGLIIIAVIVAASARKATR